MKRSGFGPTCSVPSAKRTDERSVSDHIQHLSSMWPRAEFEDRLPPIVLKHQLYSLVLDRTSVDRQVEELVKSGQFRLFKLNLSQDDYALVARKDYEDKLPRSSLSSSGLKRIAAVLDTFKDVSIASSDLKSKLYFTDQEITGLVEAGVLVCREVDKDVSWWFSLPGMGAFTKQLCKGRSQALQLVKRARHREMLFREAESRPLKGCGLPTEYLLHDLIGADQLERVETSSGTLLRPS